MSDTAETEMTPADIEFTERINRTRPDRPVWLAGENLAGNLTNDPTSVTVHATPDDARLAVGDLIKDFAEELGQTDQAYLAGDEQSITASADAWGDVVKHDTDGDFRAATDGEFVVTLDSGTHSAQEFWVHKSTVAEHFGPEWRDDSGFAEFVMDAPVEPAVYVTSTVGYDVDDEFVTEDGWVSPEWSRTDQYDERHDVAPLYIGDDPLAAAEAIEEYIGSIETPERGRGTFYGSDSYEDMETGRRYSYAAHADGYNPEQVAQIERRLDPNVAAATPLTEGQLEHLRGETQGAVVFEPKVLKGGLDSEDSLQARKAPPIPKSHPAGRRR